MSEITRRQFHAAALASVGASVLGSSAAAEESPRTKLPTVRWGKYEITRLLVGHNPIKGNSHFSKELDQEMRDYFAGENIHGREMLRRCEELGIDTCQMGSPIIEEMLRAHYVEGGKIQWIATFYAAPGKGKEELARILQMDPKPIGAQHFGSTTDRLMREGKIDQAHDTLKMLRDAGLLVGLCSHNHEVIDYVENKGWDVDFYQGAFYRSTNGLDRSKQGEVFEEEARQSMVKTLGQVSKPCIAYKILGANRHCQTPADVEAAIRFALESIKPSDVILVGMWQKYKDQVAENAGFARKVLSVA
jgi:hypothetical protein